MPAFMPILVLRDSFIYGVSFPSDMSFSPGLPFPYSCAASFYL